MSFINRSAALLLSSLAIAGNANQSLAQSTQLVVNEICPSNIDQWLDPSNNYGGWIELYNPTSSNIVIQNWRFSSSADDLRMACLRGSFSIPARGYATVWFDNYDPKYGKQMVDMHLDCDGGTLYISDNSGNLMLTVDYPEAVSRCSWARTSVDSDNWQYAAYPTPGTANTGLFTDQRLDAPEVEGESCIGSSGATFRVTIPEGCTLRYTTDGSTPTLTKSQVSTSGVFSASSSVRYRFRLFADDRLPSPVVTRTYIYSTKAIDLPIISITATSDHLYGTKLGIFTKGTNGRPGRGQSDKCNWNMDWERPAVFEYFTADGTILFGQEVGLTRCGGWSRAWEPW